VPEEIWAELPDRPGVVVSTLGRVKRKAHVDKGGITRADRVLTRMYKVSRETGLPIKGRRPFVRVVEDGKTSHVFVSDLMLEAYFPLCNRDFETLAYQDRNQSNLALDNLTLVPKFAAKIERKITKILQGDTTL
jgi:hypothetical protein